MRNIKIAPGEHYHIYNRGVNKQTIFHNEGDWSRFLFLVLYFQSGATISHLSRKAFEFGQHSVLTNWDSKEFEKMRSVEVVSFCLMPNHFHLILKEHEEGGIAKYMQRVLNAYTKYYNAKHEKSGHLFQGPYRAVHIEDNNYLLHLSAYIHRNPLEINENYKKYKWSSFSSYTKTANWSNLISTKIILDQFENLDEYVTFLDTSPTKEIFKEIKDNSTKLVLK